MSSFGYGGTNGHVIVESIDSLYPWYQHGKPKKEAKYDHSSKQPFLVCFSAHDKATLNRNVEAIRAVAADYYTTDLAHTLNLHRTKFSHRGFAVVREGQEIENLSLASLKSGIASKNKGSIGFLFTGQGVCFILLNAPSKLKLNKCIGTMGWYGPNGFPAIPGFQRYDREA